MTPVPLDLPLRPSEAAEVANLIFEHAERKPLTEEVRNRIGGRAAVLRLESIKPCFGSLARDPVHPSSYYLAVDGGSGEPLLLHMALAAAPTSSVFRKPLLIGRMRRPNGPEMVINAVAFGPADHETLRQFASRIDTAFLPRAQGGRSMITIETAEPESALPCAFAAFRTVLKRNGKNLAAVGFPIGDQARRGYHATLWAAIRAGWREGYSAAVSIGAGEPLETARQSIREAADFSRFRVEIGGLLNAGLDRSLEAADRLYETIRQARASLKTARSFDFELSLETAPQPTSPEELSFCLEWLKARGHAAQFAAPNPGRTALDALADVARRYQCALSLRALPDRITAGRVNYSVPVATARAAETIAAAAEHLLG